MTENIEVFKQNSIKIKTGFGNIYIDPFEIDDETHDADYILITHKHYDHFSPQDIAKIKKSDTVLIVPEKMFDEAKKESGIENIESVKVGSNNKIKELEFETVAMYNILKPFHPKSAGGVGYILLIDGKRIYIAGDTDATPEAKGVKCDIALIPIGGTYTMDAKKAAEFINEIKPEVAIPVHYGSIVGTIKDSSVFEEKVNDSIKVVVKIK